MIKVLYYAWLLSQGRKKTDKSVVFICTINFDNNTEEAQIFYIVSVWVFVWVLMQIEYFCNMMKKHIIMVINHLICQYESSICLVQNIVKTMYCLLKWTNIIHGISNFYHYCSMSIVSYHCVNIAISASQLSWATTSDWKSKVHFEFCIIYLIIPWLSTERLHKIKSLSLRVLLCTHLFLFHQAHHDAHRRKNIE